MTEPNEERLHKLADVLEANRPNFVMADWISTPELWAAVDNGEEFDDTSVNAIPAEIDCGTKMCAAGWAVYLWPAEAMPGEMIEDAARRILGLDPGTARRLFDGSNDEDDVIRWLRGESVVLNGARFW